MSTITHQRNRSTYKNCTKHLVEFNLERPDDKFPANMEGRDKHERCLRTRHEDAKLHQATSQDPIGAIIVPRRPDTLVWTSLLLLTVFVSVPGSLCQLRLVAGGYEGVLVEVEDSVPEHRCNAVFQGIEVSSQHFLQMTFGII